MGTLAKMGEPDQTPCSVVTDLGLHCLSMSHKKDARLCGLTLCKQMDVSI